MCRLQDDCEEYLFSGDEKINAIVGNKDRSIMYVTNSEWFSNLIHLAALLPTLNCFFTFPMYMRLLFRSLSINVQTNLLALSYSRTEDEVQERGEFRRLCWNYNSTSICILVGHKMNAYSRKIFRLIRNAYIFIQLMLLNLHLTLRAQMGNFSLRNIIQKGLILHYPFNFQLQLSLKTCLHGNNFS